MGGPPFPPTEVELSWPAARLPSWPAAQPAGLPWLWLGGLGLRWLGLAGFWVAFGLILVGFGLDFV